MFPKVADRFFWRGWLQNAQNYFTLGFNNDFRPERGTLARIVTEWEKCVHFGFCVDTLEPVINFC